MRDEEEGAERGLVDEAVLFGGGTSQELVVGLLLLVGSLGEGRCA